MHHDPLSSQQLADAADQALDPRREPTVVVLRADAGTGKTFSTLTVLLRRIHQGELQRVLVAVRDTAQDQGLAAQTQRDLSTIAAGLQLPARTWSRIVRGRDALAAETSLDGEQLERAYRAQFAWTDDVPILLVSHAHLPLVMGERTPGSLKALRQAQVLIIDEDPCASCALTDGTLRDEGITMPGGLRMLTLLAEAGLADATSVATVLRRLENPERTTRVRRNFSRGARIMAYELPGWDLIPMLRHLVGKRGQGGRTWAAFERLLAGELTGPKVPVAQRYARELTLALRRELRRRLAGTRPNRFGLWWPVTYQGQQPVIHPPQLRFCLPRVWQAVCPVVVLDAYADAAKYTAVFAPVPVRVIRLPAATPLNVLAAPTLRRHPADGRPNT